MNALELELIVNPHMGTENQTQVLYKSSECILRPPPQVNLMLPPPFLSPGFSCSLNWPEPHCIHQADLNLRELCLPLPPKSWN